MPIGEIETHPYLSYMNESNYSKYENLIIGSFPIYAITNSLPAHDSKGEKRRIDWKKYANYQFFYGGKRNQTWKILPEIYENKLESPCTFLEDKLIMTDIISHCERKEYSASDSDLTNYIINKNVLSILTEGNIKYIYFTSKELPFDLFCSLIYENKINYSTSISQIAETNNMTLKLNDIEYKIGMLVSPSGNNRFKNNKEYKNNYSPKNPSKTFDDYRIEQWKQLIIKKNFEYDGTNPI